MKKTFAAFLFLVLVLTLNGCINLNQTTVINKDGSGTIKLHYWTKAYYISSGEAGGIEMGDDIGGFSFVEPDIKAKYNSPVTEIKEFKKYTVDSDTTIHIELLIAFKDFNKLSEAKGFAKIKTLWAQGEDGMDFKYSIPQDTTIKKEYIKSEDRLNYTFEFPDKVDVSNGTIDGNKVTWNKTVFDLANRSIEMTATIKTKSKLCAMFGLELPVVLLFGLIYINRKKLLLNKLFRNEK